MFDAIQKLITRSYFFIKHRHNSTNLTKLTLYLSRISPCKKTIYNSVFIREHMVSENPFSRIFYAL